MSKLNFIKRHYKASLLFVTSCIVLLSLGFNMVILPWYDKQQMKAKEKELPPLETPLYGVMPATVTDSWEFDTEEGFTLTREGFIRLGSSDYYVTTSAGDTGSDADGFLRVMKIWNTNGTIYKTLIDKWEYDITQGFAPGIKYLSGDTYIVYYQDTSNGAMFTTTIWSSNGTLKRDVISSVTYTKPANQHLIYVSGDVFALAYQEASGGYDHFLETYKIWSGNGTISSRIDVVEFDQTSALSGYEFNPHIALVDSDTIAVVYSTRDDTVPVNNGRLVTYNISSTGDITNTYADYWAFETSRGNFPNIKKISGNVFAIAFNDVDYDGQIKTLTIANTGMITKSWIDTLEFDTSACYYNTIFTINDASTSASGLGVYGIAHRDTDLDGKIKTMNISSDGTIGNAVIDTLEFDTTDTRYQIVPVHMGTNFYAICYSGTGDDGWVCTVNILTNYASPTFANPSPTNNSVGQTLTPQTAITINDLNGDLMTVNFYENSTGSWVLRQTNSSCANGTYRWTFAQATANSQKYYWKVYINDGTHNVSNWYCFTTEAPPSQEKTWHSLYNSTLTGGNITTIYRSLFTSTLTGGNTTSIYKSLFTSTLTGGNITSGNKALFTSTLTGGNITTIYRSLFTSTLTGGNTTSIYKSLFTSTLTGGNITSGNKALFTSTLTGGNISTNTALFTSTLTGGNISSNNSLFTSLLTGGNITNRYASLFTSLLTGGNISAGTWTSLFTSNLSGGNITTNNSFFTSLLSGGNITTPHSLWTSLLTGGNTSVLTPATPYNLNLLVINPNPGNGTHNTNYLKSNASGLTTSIDVFYKNFTTPPALIPGSYSLEFDSSSRSNGVMLQNNSALYADAWAEMHGQPITGPLSLGQFQSGGDYWIVRGYLMFDTTLLPDEATITSAYVKMMVWDDFSTDDFNVTIQQVKPPCPHAPLTAVDYWKNTFAGHWGHTNTNGYTDDDWFNIVLNSAGRNDINKSGFTYWALRSDQDINQSAPVNSEWIQFYAPGGVNPLSSPHLIINFTIPNSNWQNIVNLTWLSNSSGAWVQYNKSYINHNGTITVHAINFSGIDSYFWHLEWESNHTNNGSSQVFTFTTVNASGGTGASMNGENRFAVGLISGFAILLMIGVALLKHMKKKRNGRKT